MSCSWPSVKDWEGDGPVDQNVGRVVGDLGCHDIRYLATVRHEISISKGDCGEAVGWGFFEKKGPRAGVDAVYWPGPARRW